MYTLLKPIPQGLAVLVREFQNDAQKQALDGVDSLKGENVRDSGTLTKELKFSASVVQAKIMIY